METQFPYPINLLEPCTDLIQVQGPVIEFGIEGGNILPWSVMIFSNGQVAVEGYAKVKVNCLSQLTVKALVQLANAEGFWMLPEFTGKKIDPEFASKFVTIQLPCNSRCVAVRGCVKTGPFAEIFALLKDLIAME
ncbi:hypothetical protein C7B80_12995 [Cyanosarcina cf. burmensis CCALA 770]|nr:hypothetical protein C7B80_12995 [Cyanosarcina cf. burmensis CCALA 770]